MYKYVIIIFVFFPNAFVLLRGEGMKDVVVVYPVKETALSIKALVEKSGFHVSHICALGSSALKIAQMKQKGVIICPFLMRDMSSSDLAEQVPPGFDVLALSKNGSEQYMGNMMTIPLPVNQDDFTRTVALLASSRSGFTRRNGNESDYVSKAKQALMSCENITESQAHEFLQNESMRTGKKLSEVAMDILDRLA
ncbi:MAG: ANTAR domain-containing protein, partial [Clostridiales bacterium]|nr:ANTAR domain-containing protein [Clostridiales bacterium]